MLVEELISRVWIIGKRYGHHAKNAGYEGFNRVLHLRTVPIPLETRYFSSPWGWRIDQTVARLSGRRFYSVGLLANEAAAAAHMSIRRGALYHAVYGDTDIHILGKVAAATGNQLAVSYHEPPTNLEYLDISPELVRTFSAVILVCEAQRPYFEAMVPPPITYVVPHGIDTSFFTPLGPLTEQPVCITVGSHLRDFPTLAAAMIRVWSKRPDVRLIAVGTRRREDKANPHMTLNDPRIEYLDGIDDRTLLQAYHRARIALIPVTAATANNALLEAMACGLPVVSTNCGGLPEYLGSNAGLMVPLRDPDQFAAAILKLIPTDSPASNMGAMARQRTAEFDFVVMAKRMMEVYRSIIVRSARRSSESVR
jgi:glycosyltransferase involved in cell wall biosynthesis